MLASKQPVEATADEEWGPVKDKKSKKGKKDKKAKKEDVDEDQPAAAAGVLVIHGK